MLSLSTPVIVLIFIACLTMLGIFCAIPTHYYLKRKELNRKTITFEHRLSYEPKQTIALWNDLKKVGRYLNRLASGKDVRRDGSEQVASEGAVN